MWGTQFQHVVNPSPRLTQLIKLRLTMHLFSGIGIKLILALLSLHMLLLGMTQLVVPLYSLALGASQVDLGIIIGALGVAGILLSIFSSVLSDYLGRRTMIFVSFLLWIGVGAVGLLAPPFLWLAWGQLLIGLADLFLWISGIAYLTELTPPGKHAAIQSLGSGVMGVGIVVGPALGGHIGQFAGFQQVFVLVILLGILGLVLSYRLPSAKRPTLERRAFLKQLILSHQAALELLRGSRPTLLAISVTSLGTISWMIVGGSFYLAYLNDLGLSPEVMGLLTTLRASAGMLAGFCFAFLANHIGVVIATLSGFAIGGLALAMTPFLTTVPLLALVGCLGGAADRLRMPGISTIIADGTEQGSRALALALINLSWAATSTVMPPILGLIAERISLSATFLIAGPFAVLSAILLYSWNRRRTSEL